MATRTQRTLIWLTGVIVIFMSGIGDLAIARAAESYPNRPLRFIVPYGAGGSYDLIARFVGHQLSEQLGQQVIIDNRPGAAGRIGMELAAKSTPDGYSLIAVGNTQVIAPIVYIKVPYDLNRDFTPVSKVATITNVVVINPRVPARSLTEFVALTRAKPTSTQYSSGGTGGITHLAGELFKSMSGAEMTHVPYKAGALATNAVIGGEVHMCILNMFSALPQIQAGRLRGLAVTGLNRSQFLDSLPTLDESGLKGYEILEFHSIVVPARTPPAIVARLNAEIVKAVSNPDFNKKLSLQAAEPSAGPPEQLRMLLRSEHDKYSKIVNTVGIKPE